MNEDIFNIESLILENNLGNKIINITKVSGGANHIMYKVQTDLKVYAVKRLNLKMKENDDNYLKFIFSEKVSEIAHDNGVFAISAIKINNSFMTKIGNYFYMVFDWIEGTVVTASKTTFNHCKSIAIELAKIHNIDFSMIDNEKMKKIEFNKIDFEKYINLVNKYDKNWIKLLIENKEMLIDVQNRVEIFLNNTINNLVISHTDIHRKNVIWNGDIPYIIDWESSGYINPFLEIYQVAWYWCNEEDKSINYNKFKLMLDIYKQNVNRKVIFNSDDLIYGDMYGRINWIDYNLKRILCNNDNVDKDVINISEKEIVDSINEIKSILNKKEKINKIFEEN